MHLVWQSSMKRAKVSRIEYRLSIVYVFRKYETMKKARSLMMDLALQYSSKAKDGMMQ